MGNTFTRRRHNPGRPPICRKAPPPTYPSPYPYPPGNPYLELDPILKWAARSTLPPIPEKPYTSIHTRNLAYHVYAHPDSDAWLLNLDQLKTRLDLFNGRRVIAIAEGDKLIPRADIEKILGHDCEYYTFPNDPRLREVASFSRLLWQVRSIDSNTATFYAHTKGTAPHHRDNVPKQLAIHQWRNRMYHELLDHWPLVATALKTNACVGTHKIDYSMMKDYIMHSPTGLEWGKWHFAGNFYWFRHDCIFRNPHWSEIPDDPFAAEMWLGKFIDSADAASLFQDWNPKTHPAPDLYNIGSHPPVRPH